MQLLCDAKKAFIAQTWKLNTNVLAVSVKGRAAKIESFSVS